MLAPVDFVALYEQQKNKVSQEEESVKKEGKSSKASKTISLLNGATKKSK